MANFGRITQLVFNLQKNTNDVRSTMLSSLKKLQSLPNTVLNGIQINELLQSVRSIENDYITLRGAYLLLNYTCNIEIRFVCQRSGLK